MLWSLQTLEEYCGKYKEEGEEFKTLINGVLPEGWADELPTFTEKDKGIATRLHSQTMLNALAPILPGFWGGSAGTSRSCYSAMPSALPCGYRAGLVAAHMLSSLSCDSQCASCLTLSELGCFVTVWYSCLWACYLGTTWLQLGGVSLFQL
jgi:hypothetical protein